MGVSENHFSFGVFVMMTQRYSKQFLDTISVSKGVEIIRENIMMGGELYRYMVEDEEGGVYLCKTMVEVSDYVMSLEDKPVSCFEELPEIF
jgi:hypothetical protein